MSSTNVRASVTLGSLLAAAVTLTVLAPPTALPDQLRAGLRADDGGTGLLTAAVGAAGWVVLTWLTAALVASLAARLPGALGRGGQRVAVRIAPVALRRAVGGGAAIGLALAPVVLPVAAHAAACAPAAVHAAALPSLDRPTTGCLPETSTTAPITATSAPTAPRPAPPPTTPRPAAAVPRAGAPTVYVVRPGDTLWGLARAELAREGRPAASAAVAARWPAWWQANRDALGTDPGLLHPGTALRAPAGPPA